MKKSVLMMCAAIACSMGCFGGFVIDGAGGQKLEDCRRIENAVIRLGARLNAGIGPDGSPLNWSAAAPWSFESAVKLRSDPNREPLFDPAEWQNACEIRLVFWAQNTDLIS